MYNKFIGRIVHFSCWYMCIDIFVLRDTTPLLNKPNSDHMFETMMMEIEQLLARVSSVHIF